jgi:hypothetical protein
MGGAWGRHSSLPWRPDFFLPLEPSDPHNRDRLDPMGERIRVRLNLDAGTLADFVAQYETPMVGAPRSHAVVLRCDMTHAPHYDRFDRFGRERRVWLPSRLTPKQVVRHAIADITNNWPTIRQVFYEGLR